jgi:NAD(P)H-dependent FMN reductase
VTKWVTEQVALHEEFDPEVLDLRDWPLPMFGEHVGTIGDFRDPTYSEPIVRRWNKKVAEADAYLIITPEYNRSVPGVLKNALDSVFLSFAFRNKPLAAVGYSAGTTGGARAVEHLAQIAVEMEAAPMQAALTVPNVPAIFGDEGTPSDPVLPVRLSALLEDLGWWGKALAAARADGQLAPARMRVRAAAAA